MKMNGYILRPASLAKRNRRHPLRNVRGRPAVGLNMVGNKIRAVQN